MLAVFEKSISQPPSELVIHSGWEVPAHRWDAAYLFATTYPDSTIYSFTNGSFMALCNHPVTCPSPPRSVVVIDDVYCIFIGTLDNLCDLRRHYGLPRQTSEAMLVAEAYKVLRDRAPYPPDQVLKDLVGNFAFVLFDAKNGTIFVGRDRDSDLRFHWGLVDDGSLAFSDEAEIILDMCGRSSNHFPLGCLYMNTSGLLSFVHPLNKVEAIVSRDEEGDPCGISFVVDLFNRLSSIRRVGSNANWNLEAMKGPSSSL